VVQQARNLTMVLAERAHPSWFLVRDRDAKFTASFDEVFRSERIRIIRTPVRAPGPTPMPSASSAPSAASVSTGC
jgi:hypothetical protein